MHSATGAGCATQQIETLGNYGALLSLIEVGLGSILHSFQVPFTGLCLSLNQGYLLCRISIETQDRWIGYSVSNIAAILKSLSPAGNKLGPMLSLSMQGLLFNLGTLFGINPLGLSVGMILLSLWSFIQPLVTYYFFFGEKLFHAADFLFQKSLPYLGISKKNLLSVLIAVVITKAIIGVMLALYAWKSKGKDELQDKLASITKPQSKKTGHPALLAFKDLLRPLFLMSLGLTGIFLYFSQHDLSQIIWYLMRPVAVGFMFFYFSRTLTLDRWLVRLQGGRFQIFAKGCELALTKIRKVI
jgi:hypothetical protein